MLAIALVVIAVGCGKAPEPPTPPSGQAAAVAPADPGPSTPTPASPAMSEKEKARKESFPNDAGPDSIDVSGYPAELQKKYTFLSQCGQCHTMARPINSQIWQDDAWKRYVKRMLAKPGCEIKNAKEIYEFLRDDSKLRKVAKKKEFKAHRLALLRKFKTEHPERYTLLFETRTPDQQADQELPGW